MSAVRKKLVVGNWKANGSFAANAELLAGLKEGLSRCDGVDVVVCPPVLYLAQGKQVLTPSSVGLGAQNLSQYSNGAYTGEVSAAMLLDAGCCWVIVGHSERRSLFGESDDVVAGKVKLALDAGLVPIVCVGESLAERESGRQVEVVCSQLNHVVKRLGAQLFRGVVVAYEPVWAIGTGRTATPEQAQAMHSAIRLRLLEEGCDAEAVRILYGGSVNAKNALSLFQQKDIDGALVGGASLILDSFLSICEAATKIV